MDNNILYKLSNKIITLAIYSKNSMKVKNVSELQLAFSKLIKLFERTAKEHKINNRHILAASYCLCATVDEIILQTQWGRNSIWLEDSLLSKIHKETYGGENFYIILDSQLQNIQENIVLIEYLYILLKLGFNGKYYNDVTKRDRLLQKTYKIISIHKNFNNSILVGSNIGTCVQNKMMSLRHIILISIVLVAGTFLTFNYSIQNQLEILDKSLRDMKVGYVHDR